jgi:hypothetical protein
MCAPGAYGNNKQSSGAKSAPGSLGFKLDQAQRTAASTAGGGTFQGKTVLNGVPRNSGIDAIRKTTSLGV